LSSASLSRNGSKPDHPPRVDVAGVRREQIVEAAAQIIATRGIQHLSLSAIETETGMSRGQLTYYFKAKEEILLAVFDRTVRQMRDRVHAADAPCGEAGSDGVWGLIQRLLTLVLGESIQSDFNRLQYTFLAQPGPRDEYRNRLATLYEDWRANMSAGLAVILPPARSEATADPRLLASLVQALIHGLVIQLQADPAAFDRTRMLDLCVTVLGGMLSRKPSPPEANNRPSTSASEDYLTRSRSGSEGGADA
jgi:AcrR family transcriptional regulator